MIRESYESRVCAKSNGPSACTFHRWGRWIWKRSCTQRCFLVSFEIETSPQNPTGLLTAIHTQKILFHIPLIKGLDRPARNFYWKGTKESSRITSLLTILGLPVLHPIYCTYLYLPQCFVHYFSAGMYKFIINILIII